MISTSNKIMVLSTSGVSSFKNYYPVPRTSYSNINPFNRLIEQKLFKFSKNAKEQSLMVC